MSVIDLDCMLSERSADLVFVERQAAKFTTCRHKQLLRNERENTLQLNLSSKNGKENFPFLIPRIDRRYPTFSKSHDSTPFVQ